MTRKDYRVIARALALTQPDLSDHTTVSAVGDNTLVNHITYEAACKAWRRTRDAIASGLAIEFDNFDRQKFYAATEAAS